MSNDPSETPPLNNALRVPSLPRTYHGPIVAIAVALIVFAGGIAALLIAEGSKTHPPTGNSRGESQSHTGRCRCIAIEED